MRASMVIVFTILFENAAKATLFQDQDRVQTLLPDRTYPPFREGICLGGLIRSVNNLDPF
jgi:hypothetical protein